MLPPNSPPAGEWRGAADLVEGFRALLSDIGVFTQKCSRLTLRSYQEEIARAILRSVMKAQGLTFVVILPRQSGKNEAQAQLEAYLLLLHAQEDAELVKVSPTWKPQSLNAMRRLERVLARNLITRDRWAKESGYIYRVGQARIFFLSGGPNANVVGATANVLLECDEAQDVLISKWDKDFSPMAASTNATRVFWGTMWTSRTLLARELRAAREAERKDGVRRVFVLGAEDVAAEVPAYGAFVAEQVQKLGRNHPLVKSQFFSEEIDAEGGMFPERRLAMMRGEHGRRREPEPGRLYAILVDVAGEDEKAGEQGIGVNDLANPGRDSTALTVVEVDLSSLGDELVKAPTYRVVERRSWTGVKHSALYGQIKAETERWGCKYLVIDATGVGAGLASFLDRAMPGKVIPFVFNAATKSKLGWGFLAVIETGRFKDWKRSPWDLDQGAEFEQQCRACQMEIVEGPERRMKWGVPDGTRDPATGEPVHDDWILSAALCAALDEQEWQVTGAPVVIRRADPLEEMDRERF